MYSRSVAEKKSGSTRYGQISQIDSGTRPAWISFGELHPVESASMSNCDLQRIMQEPILHERSKPVDSPVVALDLLDIGSFGSQSRYQASALQQQLAQSKTTTGTNTDTQALPRRRNTARLTCFSPDKLPTGDTSLLMELCC